MAVRQSSLRTRSRSRSYRFLQRLTRRRTAETLVRKSRWSPKTALMNSTEVLSSNTTAPSLTHLTNTQTTLAGAQRNVWSVSLGSLAAAWAGTSRYLVLVKADRLLSAAKIDLSS